MSYLPSTVVTCTSSSVKLHTLIPVPKSILPRQMSRTSFPLNCLLEIKDNILVFALLACGPETIVVNILMRMRALFGCFWTSWMDGVVWVMRGDVKLIRYTVMMSVV